MNKYLLIKISKSKPNKYRQKIVPKESLVFFILCRSTIQIIIIIFVELDPKQKNLRISQIVFTTMLPLTISA